MEEPLSTQKIMREFEEQLTALENSHGPDSPPGDPRPAPPPKRLPYAPLPLGTQPMLEAQLGEALKIMRDYADWVHQPSAGIGDCIRVGDALGRIMTASAMLATVATRLQKGEPETRHRMIVEYVDGEGGLPRRSHLAKVGLPRRSHLAKAGGGGQKSKTNKP